MRSSPSFFSSSIAALCFIPSFWGEAVRACDDCYGPTNLITRERRVRRMQPSAENATVANMPRGPLEWGQINFLHSTDTHGWLEGHIKEQNYGADWGDFVSFVKHMRQKATDLDVDLLLIDTGDLHDGNGLSDATSPDGLYSNTVFKNIDYDILTIGNHELYITDIAYETFANFSKVYGDKYLTSNVQIANPTTGVFEYIGKKYRYFQTPKGLNIMAFGMIFDFTGNSNVSKVITAATMVQQSWFIDAVNTTKPVDLFIITGHNPARSTASPSTWGTIYGAIRALRPDIPIQGFGGHSHIRDFVVYDESSTAIESGRYCETLGWVSMTGIRSPSFNGTCKPSGVPNPTQPAISVNATATASAGISKATNGTQYLYSRRYMDWNRLTFAYHANGSQDHTFGNGSVLSNSFDTTHGVNATSQITTIRTKENLTSLYGCAPQTWCMSCAPFGSPGNIYSLLQTALATVVVNESRSEIPRLIIINTGSIRFDLVEGPFTYDDSFIVSPFTDGFQYLPEVPYELAVQVLPILNAGAYEKKRKRSIDTYDHKGHSHTEEYVPFTGADTCQDPTLGHIHPQQSTLSTRSKTSTRGIHRRQSTSLVPGYTTTDDFGTDGDDTIHSSIPEYAQPDDLQANASFPTNGSLPSYVDLVFLDYIGVDYVIPALQGLGANYALDDLSYYLPETFTTNDYLPEYARVTEAWQVNVPDCPVGKGVGF